jgi:alginate O-acetyltransferase complex protein AlgI
MDAGAFLDTKPLPKSERPAWSEVAWAVGYCLIGVLLICDTARRLTYMHELLVGWLGMIGVVLLLHFGIFRLMSCGWRAAGVAARPLMNRPILSTSVSDFWGRRWNTAFRDLTHRFLFRPLAHHMRPKCALVAGFLISGLIHDLLISVPAQAGYGGPTAFFLIQAVAILVERSPWGRAGGLGKGWQGWLFTLLVLTLPAGLLFHPPFIRTVVLPFLEAIGAI